jgi:hypothetical protein
MAGVFTGDACGLAPQAKEGIADEQQAEAAEKHQTKPAEGLGESPR